MNQPFVIDQLPDRTIEYQGQAYLFFSGTAYLGLAQHSDFQELLSSAMRQYGSVFGSSRNGNLQLKIYEEAEVKLAASVANEPIDTPTALTLSSGMMAGQVVVSWLQKQGTTFVYAPKAHPALWHEPLVTLPALSFSDWVAQLPSQLQALPPGPVAILVNSLDAVWSEYYSFDWINDLPTDRPITLVVDDSHGLGVLNNGRGIWPQLTQKRLSASTRLIVTASLAKAMAMPGGIVFSKSNIIAELRRTAFFGACSPMPPAYLAAYMQASALYVQGQKRLQENTRLAEELLLPTGLFRQARGYPVFFTEHDDLYAYLLERGIFIYSFAYPTAADRANTRIVISAFHTSDDIREIAKWCSADRDGRVKL